MKILVFSDVVEWDKQKDLLDEIKPDVVALAGDLTSDGFASFWKKAVIEIPEFQKEKKTLMKKMNITQAANGTYSGSRNSIMSDFLDSVQGLIKKYEHTNAFLENRKRMHVDKFYDFLKYAGKKSKVLVVKGDHDSDFEGDYIVRKINEIANCEEISGKITNIAGTTFLGLGFKESHYLRTINSFIDLFQSKVDVVITHCEQKNLPRVSLIKPKLIIRGHFGEGQFLVNDIPAVFTNLMNGTIIELQKEKLPKIIQYVKSRGKKIILEKSLCKPWGSQSSEFKLYSWLKPYPKKIKT